LHDYFNSWIKSIEDLLENIKNISPETGGMLSEIFYWRDITRILDGLMTEL
jgi:hypothetical protein